MTIETQTRRHEARPGGTTRAGIVEPRHVVWLLALGGIWGSSYLCIKLLVDAVDAVTMIAVRLWLGASVLALVQVARGRGLPRRGPLWRHLLVMALAGNLLPFWLIAWSQRHATSALAAILNAVIPLVTLVIAAAVYREERITANRLLGIALGMAGVAALTGRDLLDLGSTGGRGALALLGASVCYGFAFAYARRHIRGDPVANVTAQLLMGAVIITPLALASGWIRPEKLDAIDLAAWVLLGAVGTGVAYLFYYTLIAELGATAASFVTYIIPVVGVVLGWLVLDERIGVSGVLGMALIIAGVTVSVGTRGQGPGVRDQEFDPA
jgi:drug/metabolite transporter (DMT)-like permease